MLAQKKRVLFWVDRLLHHTNIFLLTKITFYCAHVSKDLSVLLQLRWVVTYPIWLIYSTIRRLFGNPYPAITLKDPEVKYALRLIDKEVSMCTALSILSLNSVKCL